MGIIEFFSLISDAIIRFFKREDVQNYMKKMLIQVVKKMVDLIFAAEA